MKAKRHCRWAGALIAGGAAFAVSAYATYAGVTWYRYGRTKCKIGGEEADSLLDLYIPQYEIAERHHVEVAASAETTFAAAESIDMSQSTIPRVLFKLRELALSWLRGNSDEGGQGGKHEHTAQPKEFLAQVKAIGWGMLAEVPGHEIVLGAVTQPWLAKPAFRSIPAEEFASFHEPGYVKIAWTGRIRAGTG